MMIRIFCLIIISITSFADVHSIDATKRDQNRVQKRLKLIYELLKNKTRDHLSEEQKKMRRTHLGYLKEYVERGRFPINTGHPGQRVPYFIDKQGTACAVGYLMIRSGHRKMAESIAKSQNYSFLENIKARGLKEWVQKSGFSLEELQLIQPTYGRPSRKYSNRFKALIGETLGELKHDLMTIRFGFDRRSWRGILLYNLELVIGFMLLLPFIAIFYFKIYRRRKHILKKYNRSAEYRRKVQKRVRLVALIFLVLGVYLFYPTEIYYKGHEIESEL